MHDPPEQEPSEAPLSEAWEAFQKIPNDASAEVDRRLVRGWHDRFLDEYPQAAGQLPRVETARRRLKAIEQLDRLVKASPKEAAHGVESDIVSTAEAAQFPYGYRHEYEDRVGLALERLLAKDELDTVLSKAAVNQPPAEAPSESDIVRAWQRARRCEIQHWVGAEQRKRIKLAVDRLQCLNSLQQIPTTLAPDEYDRSALEVYKEELLQDCAEAQTWVEYCEAAARRQQLLGELGVAIDEDDDEQVVTLWADPAFDDYPLPEQWAPCFEDAHKRITQRDRLLAMLDNKHVPETSFSAEFDVGIVHRFAGSFEPVKGKLLERVRTEILPLERIGLDHPTARKGLVRSSRGQGGFIVRWRWPHLKFSRRCLLTICPDEPSPDGKTESELTHYSEEIEWADWDSGGRRRSIKTKREWAGSYVVVRAVVDLGFGPPMYSEPLVLGRLPQVAEPHQPSRRAGTLFSGLRLLAAGLAKRCRKWCSLGGKRGKEGSKD